MTSKIFHAALALFLVLGLCAMPALAQPAAEAGAKDAAPAETGTNWAPLAAIGAGLATIGGGYGIGRLAQGAMEGTARQPEAGGQIRTSMIIAAALIEGFTFFALIVCIIAIG